MGEFEELNDENMMNEKDGKLVGRYLVTCQKEEISLASRSQAWSDLPLHDHEYDMPGLEVVWALFVPVPYNAQLPPAA